MEISMECKGKKSKKKLLIYAHYYIPDTASTGQILRELAEGMLGVGQMDEARQVHL